MGDVELRIPEDFMRRYLQHIRAGRLLYRNSFLLAALSRLHRFVNVLHEDYMHYKCDMEAKDAKAGDSTHYGYEPYQDAVTYFCYAAQLRRRDFEQLSVASADLYAKQIDVLQELLGKVRRLLNLGVLYAHVDHLLAETHPDVEFHGIDLSLFTKALNEAEFGHLKNMKFHAGDIFDLIGDDDWVDSILFHSRILVLLPREFIERLYAGAFKAGFKYVCGFEPCGMSRKTLRGYTFSEQPRPSVWWRDDLFLHNYPGLLKAAGYDVKCELLKTKHSSPDHRIVCVVGSRPE